jgi:aminopeptidase
MSSDFEQNLGKYADVIVKVGLNVQPGQRLLIGMPFYEVLGTQIELAPLVRLIATKAYQVGARLVDVLWNDEQLELTRFQHAPRDSFSEFPNWRTDAALEIAEAGDAILIIAAATPGLLIAQDPELTTAVLRTTMNHMKPTIDLRVRNAMHLAIAAAPIDSWSEKVFPEIPAESRKAKSWDTIFEICRVKEADPITAWTDHIASLIARSDSLNKKQFAALKMTAPGTDLTIGLPRRHIWRSALMTSKKGIGFTANIPTEEIFTMPHKDTTEGVVTTTKPSAIGGVIEEVNLTFAGGKVVKATAKKGEERLHKLLETDEGMLRLGKIALVPHSSPISQTGLLFIASSLMKTLPITLPWVGLIGSMWREVKRCPTMNLQQRVVITALTT